MAGTYNAFISYSHESDSRLASSLHRALLSFAKPWYKLRALRVFRDQTSMSANPALWPTIEAALGQSEWLLLFASPESANSRWVQKEVDWWLSHRSADRLLLLLSGGELTWDPAVNDFDWSRTTALPARRTGTFREEPLWVDVRSLRRIESLSLNDPRFRAAVLDIAAPLHGKAKDELDGEDIREHKKLVRAAWLAVSVIGVLLIGAALLSFALAKVDEISRRRQDEITSRELAGKAYLNLPSDPALSARLAVAGLARKQTGIAEVAYRHALARLAPAPRGIPLSRGGAIEQLAFSPDDKLLAGLHQGLVHLWEAASGASLGVLRAQGGSVTALAWSKAAGLVLGGEHGELALLKDPTTANDTRPLNGHGAALTALALSSDGTLLAAGDARGNVGLNALTGTTTPARSIAAHSGKVQALALHRDGRLLASAGADGKLRLWDVQNASPLLDLPTSTAVNALTFNPAGHSTISDELLVVIDVSGATQVIDVSALVANKPASRPPAIRLPEADGNAPAAAFTGNGKCLVTASHEGRLRLREINSWNVLAEFGAAAHASAMALASDNRRYALSTDQGAAVFASPLCASLDDLCAEGLEVLSPMSSEEKLRFLPGRRASRQPEAAGADCERLFTRVLGEER
jgi:hypothetical protein